MDTPIIVGWINQTLKVVGTDIDTVTKITLEKGKDYSKLSQRTINVKIKQKRFDGNRCASAESGKLLGRYIIYPTGKVLRYRLRTANRKDT